MQKWEYSYIQVYKDNLEEINGKGGFNGKNDLHAYLKKSGEEGWEAIGICPASEGAAYWRMVFKRPLSE